MEFKEESKKIYNSVKYHLLLSFLIFLGFIILSYFYPDVFINLVNHKLNPNAPDGPVVLHTIPLFLNNLLVSFGMIGGGFILSIPTLYLLVYNACLIGYNGSFLPIGFYLAYMLPHAVIESLALIIASATGFRITQAILIFIKGLTNKNNKKMYKSCKDVAFRMFKDCLILIAVVIILLLISAYIEANITIPLGNIIIGRPN